MNQVKNINEIQSFFFLLFLIFRPNLNDLNKSSQPNQRDAVISSVFQSWMHSNDSNESNRLELPDWIILIFFFQSQLDFDGSNQSSWIKKSNLISIFFFFSNLTKFKWFKRINLNKITWFDFSSSFFTISTRVWAFKWIESNKSTTFNCFFSQIWPIWFAYLFLWQK